MHLKKLQAHWNAFGDTDPLWAILNAPEKAGGKWDLGEFFRIGENEVDGILEQVAALGIQVRHGQALDFGCGVGRLTQALCRHFEQCRGVDIAPSMIALAREHNRYGERCRYELNRAPYLRLFPDNTFDFIYSSLVLQHMRPRYAKRYMVEFLRILAPGGCVAFRQPSGLRTPLGRTRRLIGRVYWWWKDGIAALRGQRVPPRMEMYGIPRHEVAELITGHGGKVQAICADGSAGPAWNSFLYVATKAGAEPTARRA